MTQNYITLYLKFAICLPISRALANQDATNQFSLALPVSVQQHAANRITSSPSLQNLDWPRNHEDGIRECHPVSNKRSKNDTFQSSHWPVVYRRHWQQQGKAPVHGPSLPQQQHVVTSTSSSSRKTSTSRFYLSDANDIDSDFDPDFIPRSPQNEDKYNTNNNNVLSLVSTRSRSPSAADPELPYPASEKGTTHPNDDDTNNPQKQQQPTRLPHSPVIYRYYGKSRSRTRASGSIPFILLGPDVDHWRTTGEHLAARGFSVIACERDPLEPSDDDNNGREGAVPDETSLGAWSAEDWWKGTDAEGANLILNVLQASRWSKAILVACDSEAVIAIQAVMKLAPEKIAGLVLCGDLQEVEALLRQSHPHLVQDGSGHGDFAIDAFLHQFLPCPFAIAWDGKVTAVKPIPTLSEYLGSSHAECLHGNRCLILGGGIAPHRRQPETFSWALTRFVEDKVAPSTPLAEKKKLFRRVKKVPKPGDAPARSPIPKALKKMMPHNILSGDYFSTGSFVVYGRIVASALLYASMLKVGIYQYGNFLDGMVSMKNGYDGVQRLKEQSIRAVAGFFLNFGYIPLLFQSKPDPEPDLADFPIDPEQQSNFEHNDDVMDESGEADDAEKKDEEASDKETEEDGASKEESSSDDKEAESEPEEKKRFQPLFFLDRVVASNHYAPPGDTHRA